MQRTAAPWLRVIHAVAISTLVSVSTASLASASAPDPGRSQILPGQGIRLYTQEAFEAFDTETTQAVRSRYSELVEAGMDTARHLFDWRDLEPAPGIYDLELILEAMNERAERGIRFQFVNLVVLDSSGPVVPPHIDDMLQSGVPWHDPRIVKSFESLLDAVVPLMLCRGMFALGLSNEPSGYYEDQPSSAASFAGFIENAITRAHSIEPTLSCTVVFAGPNDRAIPDLMPLVDVASFNTYFYFPRVDPHCTYEGVALPLYLSDPAQPSEVFGSVAADKLDALVRAADGKSIHIQEIGQSTGWSDTPRTLGSFASLRNQRAMYLALYRELDARREHFLTVCNWTLNDHTEEGMRYLVEPLLEAGFPPCYTDNLAEIFGPTGLIRSDPSGSKKPAFDDFERAVRYFSRSRRPR